MRGPLTCGLCGSGLTYTDRVLDDGVRSTSWRCECGETHGCSLDAGTLDILDLGIERADPPGAVNHFEIFRENFEGVIGIPELTDDPTGDR